ncbi:putative ribonuclease H-like domain-containing protein [Tanacetum coccineum]
MITRSQVDHRVNTRYTKFDLRPNHRLLRTDNGSSPLAYSILGVAPCIKSIWNSTCRADGIPGKSLGNTSGKSQIIGSLQSQQLPPRSLSSYLWWHASIAPEYRLSPPRVGPVSSQRSLQEKYLQRRALGCRAVERLCLYGMLENGKLIKPVAQTTTNAEGTSTTLIPGPVTTEEKVQNKNECEGKNDLSYSGLEEFQQPKFEGYGPKTSKSVSENISNKVKESPDALLVEELVLDDKLEKKTVFLLPKAVNTARPNSAVVNAVRENQGHLQKEDQGYVDSGCSRHMTGNMSYLSDFKEFDGGYVTFGGGAKGGKITGKGTLKTDEGFFVGYSMNSKAFRVYNIRTRKVKENLHIRFLKDKPIIAGDGPKWLFDIDVLTKSMNYVPVVAGTNSNDFVGTEESIGAGHSSKETGSSQDYILMPLWKDGSLFDSSSKNASNDEPQPPSDAGKKDDEGVCKESGIDDQERPKNSTQDVNTAGPSDETEVDMSNITTTYPVPSTPNTRIHKDHSLDHVIGDVQSGVQTRRMTKTTNEQGFISAVYEGKTHEDLHTCLFACFLSQVEPKKMDVKSAFLYGKIEEEVYVYQPPGFEDPEFPDRVYKVEKALYGLHQAPRAWYETLSTYLLENGFQRRTIDKTLFIKKVMQKEDGIFISQDKYVDEILKKFGFLTMRIASTPMETSKPLLKDAEAEDVDVYLYRSMIGSLMYLTDSRPDIIFAQCKKQTIVANSTTEAEYVAAANCCGQVLWIQNQMLDYEYNFMNTKIFIDNESTICIVKNPVFHSKTKHIEIRHHFSRDSYEKRLIQVIKIHTDHNVADLLTKALDVSRFQFLTASIGMLNL